MRLFFGLPIDDSVRERVSTVQARLRSIAGEVKWVEAANLHFTLRFIGEVADAEVERVAEAAEGAWESIPPGPVSLRSVGAFPNLRRPRVIWVGMTEGEETLGRLHQSLSSRLETELGLPVEERKFAPHLTIGRVKAPLRGDALAKLVEEVANDDLGSFQADRFALYQSTLTRRGPIYRAVRTYRAVER